MKHHILFLLIALLSWVYPAHSLTLEKASIEELTVESQRIIYGTVVSAKCAWEDKEPGNINTLVTVRILESIKGEPAASLTFQQMGGKIGDFEDVVPGTPFLKEGDEVILFLLEHRGNWEIHSIALGIYRVAVGENGQKIAYNDFSNVNLIDPVTRKPVDRAEMDNVFDFNEFVNRIKSSISLQ